jgi:hypothetical protein
VVFNRLFGKMYMSNETAATVTVNDWDTGTHFLNTDNDVIEFDLPADPTDLTFCFGNGQTGGTPIAQAIKLTPNASDYLVLDGTANSAGSSIESSGDGKDNICIVGLDSGYWKAIGYQGTWRVPDNVRVFDEQLEEVINGGDGYDEAGPTESKVGAILDPDYTRTSITGATASWGDDSLQAAAGTGENARAFWNLGTNYDPFYVRFEAILDSHNMGEGNFVQIGQVLASDWGYCFRLHFYYTGGNPYIRLSIWTSGGWTTDVSGIISLDTPYRIEVYYAPTLEQWEWKINGSSEGSGALSDSHGANARYIYVGHEFAEGASGGEWQEFLDNIAIDSATWIGAE